MLIEVIVFAYPAYRYARAVEETMSKIQTGSKSRRLRINTGPSSDSARVTITNPTGQKISGEEIRLKIDTPWGIEVDNVEHATKTDSGYTLTDDLDSEDDIPIPIRLDVVPGVKYDEYQGEEIKVEVFMGEEYTSTERFVL